LLDATCIAAWLAVCSSQARAHVLLLFPPYACQPCLTSWSWPREHRHACYWEAPCGHVCTLPRGSSGAVRPHRCALRCQRTQKSRSRSCLAEVCPSCLPACAPASNTICPLVHCRPGVSCCLAPLLPVPGSPFARGEGLRVHAPPHVPIIAHCLAWPPSMHRKRTWCGARAPRAP